MTVLMLAIGAEARDAETDRFIDSIMPETVAKLPYRIDSTTIFTGVNREDNTIYYEYQLHGDIQFDGKTYNLDTFLEKPMNRVLFIQVAREIFVKFGCADTNTRFFIDKDYIINRVYYDRNDKFLFYLELNKHMCRGK